jgi:hypothetical protein
MTTQGVEAGGVGHRMAGDVDHRARGGRVHRGAEKAFGLADALALEHLLADLDDAGGARRAGSGARARPAAPAAARADGGPADSFLWASGLMPPWNLNRRPIMLPS